ncbi:MAG: DUF4157 domain-containing protein [Haloarculaceae archaeon]
MHQSTSEADAERTSRDRSGSERQSDGASAGRRAGVGALHAELGNQAVRDLHERGEVQAKLAVGSADDATEREAERVADAVVDRGRATDGPSPTVERAAGAGGAASVDGDRERLVRSALTGGHPLPAATRSFFESRFDRDFSDVRVHTGPRADAAARSIDAEAFTLGTDVAFADGNYRPGTTDGRRLLAHELAHVRQQGGTRPLGGSGNSSPDPDRSRTDGDPVSRATAEAATGSDAPARSVVRRQSDGGDVQSTDEYVVLDAGTTLNTGEYTVEFPAPAETQYIAFRQADGLDALNLHQSVVITEGSGETAEMAVVDGDTGTAIHATGGEETREMQRELMVSLQNDFGYPNGYALGYLEAQLIGGKDFHVAYEFLVWYDREQTEANEGVPKPATTGGGGGETATFPSVNKKGVGNSYMFFMQMSGYNPVTASALFSLHQLSQATGQSYGIGVSGGVAPFIAGGGVGSGVAFFPDGGVGVYGSGSVDFGAQVTAGVNLDFTVVYGGIDTFAGEVITTSVTIGPVSGSGLCAVERREDGTKVAGELVGFSFSGGLSVGLEFFARGTETTEVL